MVIDIQSDASWHLYFYERCIYDVIGVWCTIFMYVWEYLYCRYSDLCQLADLGRICRTDALTCVYLQV